MVPIEYIVGAGVVVGVTLYVLFGDVLPVGDISTEDSTHSTPGLMNLGQTCFFNAVLQALASCQSFCDWITREASTNSKHCHKTLCCLLHGIITTLKGEGGRRMAADTQILVRLLDEIRGHGWVVENSEQHDAHELFQAIMNLLHSTTDHKPENLALTSSLSLENKLLSYGKASVIHRTGIEQTMVKESKTSMLGYVSSSMTCRTCLTKSSVKYTEFTSLSLNFPPTCENGIYRLDDMLTYYFLSDILRDVNCESCSHRVGVAVRSDFTREQSIGKAPDCLCLHVQRLGWYGHHAALKRHEKIVFPAMLDLTKYTQLCKMLRYKMATRVFPVHSHTSTTHGQAPPSQAGGCKKVSTAGTKSNITTATGNVDTPTCPTGENNSSVQSPTSSSVGSPPDAAETVHVKAEHSEPISSNGTPTQKTWYRLVSVIEHRGSEVSGHFVTYRNVDAGRGKWVYTSDLDVYEVSAEHVHSRPPYMLFYEKMATL